VTALKPGCPPDLTFCEFGGMDTELQVFARHAEGGSGGVPGRRQSRRTKPRARSCSPLEAMDDLAVIAACLKSGAHNGAPVQVDREFMSLELK